MTAPPDPSALSDPPVAAEPPARVFEPEPLDPRLALAALATAAALAALRRLPPAEPPDALAVPRLIAGLWLALAAWGFGLAALLRLAFSAGHWRASLSSRQVAAPPPLRTHLRRLRWRLSWPEGGAALIGGLLAWLAWMIALLWLFLRAHAIGGEPAVAAAALVASMAQSAALARVTHTGDPGGYALALAITAMTIVLALALFGGLRPQAAALPFDQALPLLERRLVPFAGRLALAAALWRAAALGFEALASRRKPNYWGG